MQNKQPETQQNLAHFAGLILQDIDSLVLQGFSSCRELSLLIQAREVLVLKKVKTISAANHSQFQPQKQRNMRIFTLTYSFIHEEARKVFLSVLYALAVASKDI